MGNEQDFGACQTVPFPCRSFSISSSIREGKVIQLCGPIRGLSKTAKVASIRVLVVEKKIIPRVLLARPFSGAGEIQVLHQSALLTERLLRFSG